MEHTQAYKVFEVINKRLCSACVPPGLRIVYPRETVSGRIAAPVGKIFAFQTLDGAMNFAITSLASGKQYSIHQIAAFDISDMPPCISARMLRNMDFENAGLRAFWDHPEELAKSGNPVLPPIAGVIIAREIAIFDKVGELFFENEVVRDRRAGLEKINSRNHK